MFKNQKGFTLIELLVVIAIIGLLSSVVLASLNSARAKGADAAIKSNLKGAATHAEVVYDDNTPNSYSGLCANPTIVDAINSAQRAASIAVTAPGALAVAGTSLIAVCHLPTASVPGPPMGANQGYAIAVPLRTNNANSWCVDHTGYSGLITSYLASNDVTCL